MSEAATKVMARPRARAVPAPSLWAQCDAEQDSLAQIVASLRIGIRDQRHFDELEAEASAMCARIRAAFRGAR